MTKKFFVIMFSGLLALLLFGSFGKTVAQEADVKEELNLLLGEVRPMQLPKTVKRVVITDPSILDVNTVSDTELLMQAKKAGRTDLIIWSEDNAQATYPVVVKTINWEETKARIEDILKQLKMANNISLVINENENKIFMTGELEDKEQKDQLFMVLAGLKDYTVDLIEIRSEKTLVQFDVKVLEITRTEAETLGLMWPKSLTVKATDVLPTTAPFGKIWSLASGGGWTKAFGTETTTAANFAVTLNLLVESGKAKVLSAPKLICLSGKEAQFEVGGEYPVLTSTQNTSSTTSTSFNVEYKPYGLKLTVKPNVKNNDDIFTNIKAEIVDLDAAFDIIDSSGLINARSTSKRNAETDLYLKDGEMLLIAGLIKNKEAETVRKVPFLHKIPILGAAFRNKTREKSGNEQKELIISLVPKIIRPDQKDKVAEASAKAVIKQAGISQEVTLYSQQVQKKIYEGLFYPTSAKQLGWQGTVTLSLHLDYTGRPANILVKESSGYKLLDKTAVTIVASQSPYPPFPAEIKEKDLWLDIPIAFQSEKPSEAKLN